MTDIQVERPKVTAAALIMNEEEKFLLVKSPKWQNMYIIPGGHVEWGESIEDALRREVMEEVGLEVFDLHFLKVFEFVFPKEYGRKEKHFVSMNYYARTSAKPDEVKLDGEEGTEYLWLSKDEVIKKEDVHPTIKEAVKVYEEKFGKEDYKSAWQRALADYQNLQKEVRTRQSEWAEMSEQQIIEEFLPVYDNFKTAFYHHPEISAEQKQIKNWVNGIGHIMKQFGEILKSHKIEEIKTVGQKFDPAVHESVGEEDGEGESGTIVREVTGGYKMGQRIIKPARVIIKK